MKKALGVLVVLASASIGLSGSASAARGFSNHDVHGAYEASFEGFVGSTTAASTPITSVGRFFADGNGRIFNGKRTLAIGGGVVRQTFTCDYHVNPDGTGDATCTVRTQDAVSTETFDFVIVESRDEGEFVGTTLGVTILGKFERQHRQLRDSD